MKYIKSIEKMYIRNQKDKILSLWRELYNNKDITEKNFLDNYYNYFIKPNTLWK